MQSIERHEIEMIGGYTCYIRATLHKPIHLYSQYFSAPTIGSRAHNFARHFSWCLFYVFRSKGSPGLTYKNLSAHKQYIKSMAQANIEDNNKEQPPIHNESDYSDEEENNIVDSNENAVMQEMLQGKLKDTSNLSLTPLSSNALLLANQQQLYQAQVHSNVGQQRSQLFDSKRMNRVSFSSWYEFDSYFETYMHETFQPFRMRSSCSVDAYRRNQQKVMMNNKNSRGRRMEFPDSAIHHHRIYMCTHAMKARCRGATTRPGQKYRGIGCIAKINVKISPSDNPSKYMVIVTDQVRDSLCVNEANCLLLHRLSLIIIQSVEKYTNRTRTLYCEPCDVISYQLVF